MALSNSFRWYASDDPISGLSTGTHDIATAIDIGPDFIPMGIAFEIVEDANLLTKPSVSVGVTGSSYNDIAPSQSVGGFVGAIALGNLSSANGRVPAETVFKCKVNTAATHLGSGESSFRPIIWGVEI